MQIAHVPPTIEEIDNIDVQLLSSYDDGDVSFRRTLTIP
jgi:hypothetical protein